MTVISVIFASRGRPASLKAATESLYQNAKDPDRIEIIVAVDPDDDSVTNYAWPFRIWTAPERFGYTQLHLYLNSLAKLAHGEWLMWFNDDMRMLTPGWDEIIATHRPAVIWPKANHVHHANIAPAWPAEWSEITGHASPSSHMDTYWQRVGEALGLHDQVDISILHDRADVTGNHQDQTYEEGRKLLGPEGMVPEFDSHDFHRHVTVDASKIRGLL